MTFMAVFLFIVNCLTFSLTRQVVAEPIPVEILFGNQSQKFCVRISPDGQKLIYIAPLNGVNNIWIQTIGENDARQLTSEQGRGINNCRWAYDNQQILFFKDKDGDENWQLYKLNLKTNIITSLTPSGSQAGILKYHKNSPDKLLITLNERDQKEKDVYELNLVDGSMVMVVQNMGNIISWHADRNLVVRGAIKTAADGSSELLMRDESEQTWHSMGHWQADEEMPIILCFSPDGRQVYLIDGRSRDTMALVLLDCRSGDSRIIFEDARYDLGGGLLGCGYLLNVETEELEAICYTRECLHWHGFATDVEKNIEFLRSLSSGEICITSRSKDGTRWIVAFTTDTGPVSYWLYEPVMQQGTFLFYQQETLNQFKLAPMYPVSLVARDGLPLDGYITYPLAKKENIPLVLLVHGGPWSRDVWGLNYDVQFLASRGYAVLQVNYRGSAGYGKAFLNAGNKEWAYKMHDDLIDAVNWAIKQGIADPKKVAIFGYSYGGYAALVGATFTPDVFCCAVDIVGPSNLTTLIRSFPPYWSAWLGKLYQRIGNPETEEQLLRECSPLFKIDAIKIPLLIAQGANDPRVKQAESEQIVAKLKEKGLPHEYMLFPDEGHGFVKPENRIKFYKKAEEFLAKHLG